MATTLLMLLALSFLPQSTSGSIAHSVHVCPGNSSPRCSCRRQVQPAVAAEAASVVVRGTVIAFRDSILPLGSRAGRVMVAHVRVAANWKQAPVDSVVHIATSFDTADCGYLFEVGQDYLIYAYVGGQLTMPTTSLCARTQPASRASEDFEALGKPTGEIRR